MTKILNLDDLETTIEKSIEIKGVRYDMKPFSVEEFVDQMKEIEEVSQKDLSGAELYLISLGMIRRAFPGMTDDILKKMNTFQIDAIYEFMKARTEEEAANVATETQSGNLTGEASS